LINLHFYINNINQEEEAPETAENLTLKLKELNAIKENK